MNICWVLSNSAELDTRFNADQLKKLGSLWGGWRTWRSYQTDNVICHDPGKAQELIERDFQNLCNLYLPTSIYTQLNRPAGVKLYAGEFSHELDNHEDIVAMHLASTTSDIVLLLGFDFGEQPKQEDKFLEHRAHNYRSLTRQVIASQNHVQWIVVDHAHEFRRDLQDLENLGKDTLSNMLSM